LYPQEAGKQDKAKINFKKLHKIGSLRYPRSKTGAKQAKTKLETASESSKGTF
jgi:hypothetical protein